MARITASYVDSGPLLVEIREGRRVVRVVRIRDPRKVFCREFNELHNDEETSAPGPRRRERLSTR